MIRLFQRHRIRKNREVHGLWEFQTINASDKLSSKRYQLPVPSCWEMHPEFLTYRGKAIYRKYFEVKEKTNIRLEFKGVSHTATVLVDGNIVATHYNAYTPFSVLLPNVDGGEHLLEVLVDNRFTEDSALHIPNDYYTYGGIIRSVILEEIPDCYIEKMKAIPKKVDDEWHLELEAHISNLTDERQKVRMEATIADTRVITPFSEVEKGKTVMIRRSIPIQNIREWSSQKPNLYELELNLYRGEASEPIDDQIDRIGFRTITTLDGHIQLNGENIVMRGFNRHEDHPQVGASFSQTLMVHDLELMKDMGANTVRTSHYPNDELFLDLCDEMGFFVWEENHARGLSLERMQHPKFQEQCLQVNEEMVTNHIHHPSIIIWGILNECASNTEEGREMYKEQIEQIRALDNSRPVTFASHHRAEELCFDLVDICSFNLYPKWYTDEDPKVLVEEAKKWAEELGGKGKPMIMSEFGGDGIYGYRSPTHVKGTEERQAEIIRLNLKAYEEKSYISGMLIWQFADCRVTEGLGFLLTRAGTMNQKGMVDTYRRPKLAYQTVQEIWKKGDKKS
ncbi:glycoside hydrolase family 2 protein [Saliterribacillus persicus]|uniref:Beta-glucuronidase n=1 Tax=Saliterribacillus persicus TaxID=930114 RepID=A0A368YGG0_9BACI|nr:glycoside hydrolase family 2 TIM barrel-domain containing protein [Saliterribacillus persicus]RCW77274.1 beta-glucuronidase [Saliterribacillus persicus]